MGNLVNKGKSYLKEVYFRGFFDYLALDLNIDLNLYKYSDYLKLLEILNKNKKIRKFNNFRDKYDLLDLVCYNYYEDKKIKLYYNKQNLYKDDFNIKDINLILNNLGKKVQININNIGNCYENEVIINNNYIYFDSVDRFK